MSLGAANINITTNASQVQAQLSGLQRALNSLKTSSGSKTSLIPGLTQTTTQVNGLSAALKNMAGSFVGASMGAGGLTQSFTSVTQSSNALTNSLLGVMLGGKSIKKIFVNIGTSVGKMGSNFKNSIGAITSAMSSFKNSTSGVMNQIVFGSFGMAIDKFRDLPTLIWSISKDNALALKAMFITPLSAIPSAIGRLKNVIIGNLSNIGSTIGNIFNKVGSTMSGLFSRIGSSMGNLFTGIFVKTDSLLSNLFTGISSGIGSLNRIVRGELGMIGDTIKSVFNKTGGSIQTVFSHIDNIGWMMKDALLAPFQRAVQGIRGLSRVLVDIFKDTGISIAAVFTRPFRNITNVLSRSFRNIGNILTKPFRNIGTVVSRSFRNIGAIIDRTLANILTRPFGTMADVIKSSLGSLRPILNHFGTGIRTIFRNFQLMGTHTGIAFGQMGIQLRMSARGIGHIFSNLFSNVRTGLSGFLGGMGRGLWSLGGAFMGMATIATVAIGSIGLTIAALIAVGFTALIAKIVTVGIKYNTMIEQMRVGYGVMLQGFGHALDYGEKSADRLMAKLKEFANVTPFTMPQVAKGADYLLGYGIGEGASNQVEQVTAAVRMLGDVSKGIPTKLNLIAYAYGQIYSMGRLQGQELRQLINAGWNPLLEMSATATKKPSEAMRKLLDSSGLKGLQSMGDLKEAMSNGAISIDLVTQALIDATSKGGRFYDMMKKQSLTMAGRWSTLVDKIGIFSGKATEGLFNSLKGALENIINLFDQLANDVNMQHLADAFDLDILPVLKEIGSTLLWIIGLRDNMINVAATPDRPMSGGELRQARSDFKSGKSKSDPDLKGGNIVKGKAAFVDMGNSISSVTQKIGGLLKGLLSVGVMLFKVYGAGKILWLGLSTTFFGLGIVVVGFSTLVATVFYGILVIVNTVALGIGVLIEGAFNSIVEMTGQLFSSWDNFWSGMIDMVKWAASMMLTAITAFFLNPFIASFNAIMGMLPEGAGSAFILPEVGISGSLFGKPSFDPGAIIKSSFTGKNETLTALMKENDAIASQITKTWDGAGDTIKGFWGTIRSNAAASNTAWNDLLTPIDVSSIDKMLAGFASKNKKGMAKLTDAERNALLGATNSAKDPSGEGSDKGKKGADKAAKALKEATDDAKGLAESIMGVTDALVNMGNTFEKVTYEKFSPYKLMVRMNRFLTEMKDWTKNLSKLQGQGVPAGMANELSKMGMQGYGMVKALTHASDAQRAKIISQYQEARSLGWNVAEAQVKWEQNNIINVTGNSIVSPQLVDVLTDRIVQKIRLNTGT